MLGVMNEMKGGMITWAVSLRGRRLPGVVPEELEENSKKRRSV